MTERFDSKRNKPVSDFEIASLMHHSAIDGLVKHLAQIAASRDYKDFLNSRELGYDPDTRKGPGS